MKQVLQHVGSGELEIAEVPEPACTPGHVVVRNAASLISAGTEKTIVDFASKSLIGKAHDRPDLVRKVVGKIRSDGIASTIRTVSARLDQTIALGYSCAGIVDSVGAGAEEFVPGQLVACAGMGHASHAGVVSVPKHLVAAIPSGVELEDAAYVTLGAIALQGVRIAAPTLGECVAVIGLGVLGLLTVQLLRANGCRVIAIDLDPERVARARALGADAGVARTDDVAGAVAHATNGIGADAVIITAAAESSDPIELAGAIARDRGRVVVVGAVKIDVPRESYFAKELEVRMSRSYGPGRYDPAYEQRGHDYPIGYVRWTEQRNMQEFLRLVSTGQVTPSALTTHRFPVDRAGDAYDIVAGRVKAPFAGILLQYSSDRIAEPLRTVRLSSRPLAPDTLGVGFIGAGGFATNTLLPRFAKRSDASLRGVATTHGTTAANAGKRFGFSYATTDTAALLADASIHAVVIATRHGTHASLAADAMRAGKDVLVEKPVAIDETGLAGLLDAQRTTGRLLTAGFNRRFSPLSAELRSAFPEGTRLAIDYRVNAGRIPADSWINDPVDGGGRIVGEVCHFIDLCSFVTGDAPSEVFAWSTGGDAHDTVAIVVKFARGSVATIDYFTTGDAAISKERIEVYSAGTVALIDDFRELHITHGGNTTTRRLRAQDKGFDAEIDAFLTAVKRGGPAPIAIDSIAATTRATFAIVQSLHTGAPIRILS